jgi:methionyl-tRNA formyltransferase
MALLNRHLGLGPDFRGSDCAVWAFALDRPESAGYSIHVLTERVDAGDVIVRRPVPVGDEPSLEGYLGRLQREASNGFVGVIDQVLQGATLSPVSQAGKGRYFPPAGWSIRRQAKRNFARVVARLPTAPDVELQPATRNVPRP